MSRSTLLAFVLTLLVSSIGGAQKPAPGNPDDALLASPANFKLLFENEYVRVVEYVVQPGQQDQWHTHPAKVSYVAEGGALRISTADGQSFLADEKTGTATWAGPVGRHFVQNVGTTTVRIILTEVKGAQ